MKGRPLDVRWLGTVPYDRALTLQEDLVRRRRSGDLPDQLLLLEHPHVITLGSGAHDEHVLAGPDRRAELGISLAQAGRGGDVTYHGPGQLVAYPILDLKPDRKDIHRYLRDLEEVVIRSVAAYGIESSRVPDRTGVWTERGKIAAVGVRVSSGWITSHGFALNLETDLSYFETIVPCGISDASVTSVSELLGRRVAPQDASAGVVAAFSQVFGCEPRNDPQAL